MTLSLVHLKSQAKVAIAKAREKQREPTRLGFFSTAGWTGPSQVEIDRATWRIAEARSSLAARVVLAATPREIGRAHV